MDERNGKGAYSYTFGASFLSLLLMAAEIIILFFSSEWATPSPAKRNSQPMSTALDLLEPLNKSEM